MSTSLISFLALTSREVHRFLRLWMDTVVSPVVSTLLFLAIFMVIAKDTAIDGIPYLIFMFAGLLTMNVITGSFSNPAFALVIARNTGTLPDLKSAPLPPLLIALAYGTAAMLRSVIIAAITFAASYFLLPTWDFAHPFLALAALLLVGLTLGLTGTLFGISATRFESLPFITSFILQPLMFLGGVFYAIDSLPEPFRTLSTWNPLHHAINLIRYLLTGYADTPPQFSLILLLILLPLMLLLSGVVMRRHLRK